MVSTVTSAYLPQYLQLFPAPLQIRKKTRRSTFGRLAKRRPTYDRGCGEVYGPLDDIIHEITDDIWHSPLDESLGQALGWHAAVELHPIIRVPSDQPLNVRKTRKSRSNTSGSSISDIMGSFARKASPGESSGAELENDLPRLYSSSIESASGSRRISGATLPGSGTSSESEAFGCPTNNKRTSAQQQLSTILESSNHLLGPRSTMDQGVDEPPRSLKRFFSLSNRMGRLRLRTDSGDAVKQNTFSAPISPASLNEDEYAPTLDAVSAWIAKNARRASMMRTLQTQVAKQYPSPHEYYEAPGAIDSGTSNTNTSPILLSAAVRILPEVRVLSSEEQQTFWVAVEVEGVLHNRHPLTDPGVDVIILVDTSYYVTNDCLNRALDIALGALHDMTSHDRLSLYTSHCTHEAVTGTVPDLWFPLSVFDTESAEVVREMIADIRFLGTQTWVTPRPNPPMAELISAVIKSLDHKQPRRGQTHLLVLSPTVNHLHELSKAHTHVRIHQINPAVLPFRSEGELNDKMCNDDCCETVTVNNWAYYQSPPDRIRQILRHARLEAPFGVIYNVTVDIRRRSGCEVIKYEGPTTIPQLRLGQQHVFFAQVQVERSQTKEMDLESDDPVRDSYLSLNNTRQDLFNAAALGASKVHLLSAQVMSQNTLQPINNWIFSETPLFVIKELGRLAVPKDRAMELYKRRFFYHLSRLEPHIAIAMIPELETSVRPELKSTVAKLLSRMEDEIGDHQAIISHESFSRQKLPMCPGPIAIAPPHTFLREKCEARKKKRAAVKNGS